MGVEENAENDAALSQLVGVDFEVFGRVQGCNLTKCCRERCLQKGITGWVKNSKAGTVMGKMQGTRANVESMIHWLKYEGTPGCKIEKLELNNPKNLNRLDYKDFAIRF